MYYKRDNFDKTKPEEDLNTNCPYISCYGKVCSEDNCKYFCRLLLAEEYFNGVLDARGYVFLNEVYEYLGYEKTEAGDKVGWIKDNPEGDGKISFEIYHVNRIYIDFNVDGVIIDKIKKKAFK